MYFRKRNLLHNRIVSHLKTASLFYVANNVLDNKVPKQPKVVWDALGRTLGGLEVPWDYSGELYMNRNWQSRTPADVMVYTISLMANQVVASG